MEFPAYVPLAVRTHAQRVVSDGSGAGLAAALESADADVRRLLPLGAHRAEYTSAKARRDALAADLACIRRLVNDARMQPVYALLAGAFDDELKMFGFIYAAWSARMDYAPDGSGPVGAAISGRKHNPKIEYLRAFGALMRDVHRIDGSAVVVAMAITATVVLNDPSVDVTPADVRSATMRKRG
ncbi:MAG TPA: hypothetical protein PKB14_21065 [Rubrivivax sp.]|nr:hypothetical protein [Rubrivivax sp.]